MMVSLSRHHLYPIHISDDYLAITSLPKAIQSLCSYYTISKQKVKSEILSNIVINSLLLEIGLSFERVFGFWPDGLVYSLFRVFLSLCSDFVLRRLLP